MNNILIPDIKIEALEYSAKIQSALKCLDVQNLEALAFALLHAWKCDHNIYICGNGGSAENALHIANDLIYGVGACGEGSKIPGIRVEALTGNVGVLTCLANDTGYENIFTHQLRAKANKDDVLIILSGSGNSKNVISALEYGNSIGMPTFAVVAYDGGRCKSLAKTALHFPINDMQIAEDLQLIIFHICSNWLSKNKPIAS